MNAHYVPMIDDCSIECVKIGNRRVYVLARWDERANQWHAPMTKQGFEETGCHTIYSRNIEDVARSAYAMRYASHASAKRAIENAKNW